jgi:hypothetical protein
MNMVMAVTPYLMDHRFAWRAQRARMGVMTPIHRRDEMNVYLENL